MNRNKKVYTLGPEESFHHLSCKEYLGNDSEIAFCESFEGIFEAVRNGNLGWIAIWNTMAGPVGQNENIIRKAFQQLDEYEYEVELSLCASKALALNEIEKIYSHEKALQEAAYYLKHQLPKAERIKTESTSKAAALVQSNEGEKAAAICHASTAVKYNLNVIAQVKVKQRNMTVFNLII